MAILVPLILLAAQSDPPYIFGLHEPGGEQHMADMGKKGWILFTEEVGRDPANFSGKDFRPWSNNGYGVIVRVNHGYGPNAGTVPYQKHYDAFSQRVANYVAASPGAHIWIIGNETNLSVEWPRYEGWEEPVPAALYVDCFTRCRNRIKALAGHSGDQVVAQPTAPWSIAIGTGWVEYHVDMLNRLGSGGLDGIALHTYTHGSDPNLIWSDARMNPPYDNRYYNFKAYRDFMNAHPTWARSLPVYITETSENGPWADVNSGWVRNAYSEINWWNQQSGTQKIRALTLYRWPANDQSYIKDKWGVINDFRDAMKNDYRWTTSTAPPPAPAQPDVIVTSLSYSNGLFTSVVRNQGAAATPSGVSIGVGYFVDGVYRTWGAVTGPLAAGASVTIGTNGGAFTIPTGTHTMMALVDDVNRFAESNENNNSLSQSITIGSSPPPPTVTGSDFETMPAWTYTSDATWGGPAAWTIASGGQSGNCLQAARGGAGSSARVLVFTVPANTTLEVPAWLKCPVASGYWMEFAFRLGRFTAGDFDTNAAAWTMVKKFSSSGENGNGNAWTRYAAQVATGSTTELSIGFKLGSSPGGGPTVGWDTLRIGPSGMVLGAISVAEDEPAAPSDGSGGGGSCGLLGLESLALFSLRRRLRAG